MYKKHNYFGMKWQNSLHQFVPELVVPWSSPNISSLSQTPETLTRCIDI